MGKEQSKKRIYQILMALLAIGMVVCAFLTYRGINSMTDGSATENDSNKVSYKTDLYVLPSNPNTYQRELYEELALACNSIEDMENEDLSELCGILVKNFIADFFTWNNKRGSYDVGGIDYVFGPSHMNFSSNSRQYYYYDLDLLIEKYGVENLPEVTNIQIESVEHQDDTYQVVTTVHDYSNNTDHDETEEYDAYLVKASWDYILEEGSSYDASKLPTFCNFMVVLRAGRVEIAYFHVNYVRDIAHE